MSKLDNFLSVLQRYIAVNTPVIILTVKIAVTWTVRTATNVKGDEVVRLGPTYLKLIYTITASRKGIQYIISHKF